MEEVLSIFGVGGNNRKSRTIAVISLVKHQTHIFSHSEHGEPNVTQVGDNQFPDCCNILGPIINVA